VWSFVACSFDLIYLLAGGDVVPIHEVIPANLFAAQELEVLVVDLVDAEHVLYVLF